MVQDESDRRTWLVLDSCVWIFFGLLIFHTLLFLLKEKPQQESDIQNCKFLISRTRTISTLPISSRIGSYLLYLS